MVASGGPPSASSKKTAGLTYRTAGVDIDAGNALVKAIGPLAAATTRKGSMGGLGGFGALFDPKAAGFKDPILVSATDGVGTKVKIAIETGRHATIGIDLVAMCVNDLVVQGAEPLFFLDYFACGTLDVKVGEAVIAGVAAGCQRAGAALVGGETAEMPGLYALGDYDLAGFAVGAAERGALLPRDDIAVGDVILGLASSGLHSNGFSFVRRLVSELGLSWDAPAPFAPERSLGEALLEPTRIYVRPLLEAIRAHGAIKALAHITGGGLPENLPRVLPPKLAARIDLNVIPVPPVFGWIARASDTAPDELLRVFNCGIGMAVVVEASQADAVRQSLEAAGETVVTLGAIADRGDGPAVVTVGALRLTS